MLPVYDIELLMRSGGGLERKSNFEWLNGLIQIAARLPAIDSPALPFLAFETAECDNSPSRHDSIAALYIHFAIGGT